MPVAQPLGNQLMTPLCVYTSDDYGDLLFSAKCYLLSRP